MPDYTTGMRLRDLVAATRNILEARRPPPDHDVAYGLKGRYDEKGRYAIARHLVRNDEVRVWDPKNILLKLDVGKWLRQELEGGFAVAWERYGEQLANEDDPKRRARLRDLAKRNRDAITSWRKVKPVIRKEPGNIVVIKLSPSFREVKRKHGLTEDTMAINTGLFVRPLGPMLPPAPLPGYEDAADLLDPPKRKRLDSRPKKKSQGSS